jgi:hypothetical protein
MFNHLQTLSSFFRFPVSWATYNGIENKQQISICVSKKILFHYFSIQKLKSSEAVSKMRKIITEGEFFRHLWQYYRSRKNKHFNYRGETDDLKWKVSEREFTKYKNYAV